MDTTMPLSRTRILPVSDVSRLGSTSRMSRTGSRILKRCNNRTSCRFRKTVMLLTAFEEQVEQEQWCDLAQCESAAVRCSHCAPWPVDVDTMLTSCWQHLQQGALVCLEDCRPPKWVNRDP